jgi:hypothetical protein
MSVIFASFILLLLCALSTTASIHRSAYFLLFVRRRVPFRSIATHITALLIFFWCELNIQINMRGRTTLLNRTALKPSGSHRFPVWNLLVLSWIPNLWSTRNYPHNIITRRGDSCMGFELDDCIWWRLIHITRHYRQCAGMFHFCFVTEVTASFHSKSIKVKIIEGATMCVRKVSKTDLLK